MSGFAGSWPKTLPPSVPDIIAPDLDILFVGYNPGLRSGATGHHFASPANRFWKLLHESGLTPRRYSPDEDRHLLFLGYGITNIVSRVTKTAAELTKEEFRLGCLRLLGLLRELRPRIACYEGIGVYRELTQWKKIGCGLQRESIVPGVLDFVVPSPSGLNRIPYPEQLAWYVKLMEVKESGAARRAGAS